MNKKYAILICCLVLIGCKKAPPTNAELTKFAIEEALVPKNGETWETVYRVAVFPDTIFDSRRNAEIEQLNWIKYDRNKKQEEIDKEYFSSLAWHKIQPLTMTVGEVEDMKERVRDEGKVLTNYGNTIKFTTNADTWIWPQKTNVNIVITGNLDRAIWNK